MGGRDRRRVWRWRLVRGLKWAGLAACVLIAAVFAASVWWRVEWASRWRLDLMVGAGCAAANVEFWDGRLIARPPGLAPWFGERNTRPLGWRAGVLNYTSAAMPGTSYIRNPASRPQRYRQVMVVVPLWMPLAAFAVPTSLLWWLDRRRPRAGACPSCGYALAGLPAGVVCPECGAQR